MKTKALITLPLLTIAGYANAAGPFDIPTESGWSGFVSAGVNVTRNSSNLYLGPSGEDGANKQVNSLTSDPSGKNQVSPAFNLDLRYTLGDSGTQFYLGNLIQDTVRLDFSQQLGVRQRLGQSGIVSVSYVFSGFPNKVWQDPYAIGTDRSDTRRDINGVQVGWQNIMGSNFSADYSYRDISVDSENSGQFLLNNIDPILGRTLTQQEVNMLKRSGKSHTSKVSYFYAIDQRQSLIPEFRYVDNSLDGDAMSNTQFGGLLSYFWRSEDSQYNIVSNLYLGKTDYSDANPVFGQKTDSTDFAANVVLFKNNIFDVKKLSAYAGVAYGEINSDVNFFNTTLTNFTTGLLYRF